ncbi:MAG: tyrosine-protein phosphatase [Prevotellaceae bacterium]|nr:tyrosine-protein phosphatase [Prevotellaceae bacterium]
MKKIFILFGLLIASQLWAQSEIEVINIEHAALQAYMADSTYHYNDNVDHTVITKYADHETYGTNLDQPQGKQISWSPAATPEEIAEIRITLSEHDDMSDSITCGPSKNDVATYTIRNLFPNRVYYYKAEEFHHDGSATLLDSGVFRTAGQVRMMRVEGASNVRDIGGWQTQFGKRIKYGILYRSGHMDNVSEAGYHEFVENMGVTAELDLRGLFRREPHLSQSRLGDSVQFVRIVADSYGLSSQRAVYAKCFNWIVERLKEGRSVNWHCGVGCDRCGTLSFLIEGVLGVSEVDLCRDYELSCFRGHKRYRGHVGFRKMLPMIKKMGPEDDLAQCFYNYWVESGVPALNIEYLRTVMLGVH